MRNLLIDNLLIYDSKNKLINVINSNNLKFNYLNYCYKNNYKIINSTNLLEQIVDIF